MRIARFMVIAIVVAAMFEPRCPAQQRLSGRVITTDGTPVVGAIARLRSLPDSVILAGMVTDSLGRFEFSLTGIDDAATPRTLHLAQNWPNPFSASTTFEFVLSSAGAVSLAVFDRMGRRVASLLSGALSAGTHRLEWDGKSTDGAVLPAGQYFVVLQTVDGFRSRLAIRSSGAAASFPPASFPPAAVRLVSATAYCEAYSSGSYRLDVIDTVTALPRFQSRSVALDLGRSDTAVTVVVAYGGWEDLGFPSTRARKLFFDAPYLYVCALQDGLWRRDVHAMAQWEFLGLADSSVIQGVTDVDARGNRLLVGYNGNTHTQYHPDSTVSVWRSSDAGAHWYAVDSTIRAKITFNVGMNAVSKIQRSPHQPGILFAIITTATAVFRSTDDGCTWALIHGRTHATFGQSDAWWHSTTPGILFIQYSATGISCYASYGDSLLFTTGDGFFDMAFPPFDSTRMYGIAGLLYSSSDTGRSWQTITDVSETYIMLGEHPSSEAFISWLDDKDLIAIFPLTRTCTRITRLPAPANTDFITDRSSRYVYFLCDARVMRIRL